MKWKITAQFLAFMVFTLLLSFFAFLTINVLLFYTNFRNQDQFLPYQNPSYYTLDFEKNIQMENGQIIIPDQNLTELKESDVWIQILDENGTEIYSRYKPKNAPVHYTAADLIHYHKFTGALEKSTIFVGKLERENRDLSYIMGFPEKVIGKATIYYRSETLIRDVILVVAIVVTVILGIALMFGYFFSNQLAKPIVKIIEGIQSLAKGHFNGEYKPKGIYKTVFQHLNELSAALKSNEIERNKIEKTREEWVTNISHDIKTPLASIRGYTELIEEYDLDDSERKRYAEIILDKSDYIERLINDLNLTYKLKNPSFPLKKQEENLIEVIRESVIQILNHPLYEETNIDFLTEIENYPFKCDKILMQRAMMNLLYNAIVHNPPDTPIQVLIKKADGQIQILIEDHGAGIAQEELENLFIRYYRGTNTGEAHKGSGLGLAIAKQIVEAHGGKIHVETELGKGTRICILFD